jgi:hypothetical protein
MTDATDYNEGRRGGKIKIRSHIEEVGLPSLGSIQLWFDDKFGRLNHDGKGIALGDFDADDKILVIHTDGTYELTDQELTQRFNPEEILLVEKFDPEKTITTPTLNIISDRWVYLYTMHSRRSLHPVRIIKALKKADGEPISFLTNITDMKPKEITEIYKSRWDIEVFFKFIKQHLNFSHLLNRSENGIRIILYVTMTAAILLLHYKKEKMLKGFKIVKQKFAQDLERDIIYNLVIICDGNPKKAKKILYPDSS